MEEEVSPSVLQSLEARTSRLERRLKFATCGWLLTIAAGVVGATVKQSQAKAPPRNEPAEVLRVRRLIVVDDKGAERVVIAAPLSDPLVDGQRRRRRSPATGVQLNDTRGNERGGVALMDDGTMAFGIDDEKGNERAHLYYIPGRGAGLLLKDAEGKTTVSLPDKVQE